MPTPEEAQEEYLRMFEAACEATEYFTDDQLEEHAAAWMETEEGKAFVAHLLGGWEKV